jgi:hypothetical protein
MSMVTEDPAVARDAIDGFVRDMLAAIPPDRRSVFIV